MADGSDVELQFSELALRKVETLEEAFALIEDLREYVRDSIARSIDRDSEYEVEILRLRDTIAQLEELANEIVDAAENRLSQVKFLSQVLVAIVRYEGNNPEVVRTIAAAAVDDFLPRDEE
jgi:dihydroneopterin aldolase